MNKWKKLIEENEEKIIEALEKIYEESTMISTGQFRYYNCAILHEDGEITFSYEQQSETHGAVWNGNAIYLGRIKEYIPWEDDYESDWIIPSLTDKELEEYEKWLEEEEEIMAFITLEEWNEDVYQRVVCDCIDAQIVAHAHEWAQEQYDRLYEEYVLEQL
ncbi:MAG: hypothetical protein ACH0QD_13515 [Tepidibacillus sp.]